MKANEIEIATADVIVLDYSRIYKLIEGNYPEFDAFIWQPSIIKYKRLRPDEPISEFSADIVSELIHQLFMVKAVKDYNICYEYPSDNMKGMPKRTAYLYLKEMESSE